MENAYVVCPECGKEIPYGYMDELLDISSNVYVNKYWETYSYTCPECSQYFTARVQYNLTFEKIVP